MRITRHPILSQPCRLRDLGFRNLGNDARLCLQSIAMKEQYYKFRDRSALIMLLGPGLLAVGMARAEAVRGQSLSADLSYAPGLMTGEDVMIVSGM